MNNRDFGAPAKISSLCFLLLSATPLGAQPLDWDFDNFFRDQLLYIHPIVNYELHPMWYREWKDNLFADNSVRYSFGSVTLTELLCDSRMIVNQRLLGGLWFRFQDTWYASHHINEETRSTFTGLEQYIWKGLSVFCYGDLAFDKEDADILFGISISDSTRSRFARIAFLDEDQFYDEKNDRRGVTKQRPLGTTWLVNQRWGRMEFFSEGRYSTGFRRRFPNPNSSPDIASHDQRINDAQAKLYWNVSPESFFEIGGSLYQFSEDKRYREPSFDYDYTNHVAWGTLRFVFPFRENLIRIGSHYLRQSARSRLNRVFSYKRRELLPFFFVELKQRFGTIDLGYMGSAYHWEYDADVDTDSYARTDYVDKVKLGYSYTFNDQAKILLSISHVVAIEEFGGGNAQFLLFF